MILARHRITQTESLADALGAFSRSRHKKISLKFSQMNMAVFSRDPISQEILEHGYFEHEELRLIIDFLKKRKLINGSALDIGANIGNHSLFFDMFFDSVHAFEPHPLTYKILEINSHLGKNISTHNIGASDKKEKVIIYNEPYSLGGASLHPNGINDELQKSEIFVEPLDSREHLWNEKIGLIKIDVEGHELQALSGCKGLIKKNKPVLMFEQHPRDFGAAGSEVINFIKKEGYSQFATINRRLNFGLSIDTIKQKLLKRLAMTIFGYEIRLELVEKFDPRTYPAIIALPMP